jgi:flagellar motility protein MotE (MotC chaperone)
MILKIPTPRLLPVTIATLGALLVLKFAILSLAAMTHGPKPESAIVAAANAASTDGTKETAKPHGGAPPPHTPPAPEPKPAVAPPPMVAEGPPPVSESEKALLQELRKRRQELDARAEAIATRESILFATEQKLSARVNELRALQTRLEGLDTAQKQKEDAGWQGLVKLYEAMKPKDAAVILNDLSMPVLLQVMDRMKDAKAAAVMTAMNPDKARDVTAELAQMRTGRDASGAPVVRQKSNPTGS